jgi:glutamine transport system permease protein
VAEIFRAGIQSVDRGQTEAGRSLGLTWFQTMREIVIPQAFKRIIPPLGNEFIAMLKDSSLVSVIGFEELTRSWIFRSVGYGHGEDYWKAKSGPASPLFTLR